MSEAMAHGVESSHTPQPEGGAAAALPPSWAEPASRSDADSSGKAHISEIISSKSRSACTGLLLSIHPVLSFLRLSFQLL